MTDALARLKNKKRPSVPPRDSSIASTVIPMPNLESLDISIPGNQEAKISAHHEIETPKSQDIESSIALGLFGSSSPDIEISGSQETENSGIQESKISMIQGVQASSSMETFDAKSPDAPELVTKQTTMRLEVQISDRLHDLCRSHGVSREVLIESMFLKCEGDSELMQSVVSDAVRRNQQRVNVANRKRVQTMMEKIGS
jgi:hypothetical protein